MADSVRLALPSEARAIAGVQRRHWTQVLPEPLAAAMLDNLVEDEMAEAWHTAITRPPQARYRVLVAVEQRRVVGFATTLPCADPDTAQPDDGEIDEFVVDPLAQRRGHGSRLMHACVDTLRADGFTRALHWVGSTDDIARTFFLAAGWAADGSHRELGTADDTGESSSDSGAAKALRLRQVRLHTDIAAS